jgi:hypothetical protein
MRREIVTSHSAVIVREGGRSSIPETPMIEPISRGVLDHPLSRIGVKVSRLWIDSDVFVEAHGDFA